MRSLENQSRGGGGPTPTITLKRKQECACAAEIQVTSQMASFKLMPPRGRANLSQADSLFRAPKCTLGRRTAGLWAIFGTWPHDIDHSNVFLF